MGNQTADQVITYKHKRAFIQYGGARPNKPLRYSGQDAQQIAISGVEAPETGGTEPINLHDPRRLGKYKQVGRTISAPDLASATVMFRENHGNIPRTLRRVGCFNLYEPTGSCRDLSDFLNGWSDYTTIYSLAIVNDKSLGDRVSFDEDDAVVDELSITLNDIYAIGALGFGEEASSEISREVVDVVYASTNSCDICEDPADATQRIYAITKSSGAASPGVTAEVIYTTDGGGNWYQATITGLGVSADPVAIDIVGDYLVVVVASENAYYYAPLSTSTGVPGSWTKVTTGFVSTKTPNDIYVLSPREVFFAAEGGYIYKATDITSGVTAVNAGDSTTNDLKRIHGDGNETIVVTGESGTVLKSINRGNTFANTITSPTSATVTAVAVLDRDRYWIGTSGGKVYWTLTGGETWTEQTLSGNAVVYDIVFGNDEVGFIAAATADPTARLYSTWNGGADWALGTPSTTTRRFSNIPTFSRPNRLALPGDGDATIRSNFIAVAGLSGGGTDGVLYIGSASFL